MASPASKQARRPAPANFIEALKDLSSSVVSEAKIQITRAVTSDIPQAFGLGSSGDLKPNQAISMEDLRQAEAQGERRGEARVENRLQQERLVYLKSESENKNQITSLLSEIQMLAKATGSMAKQVEIATMQAPANPGVYHKNFFEQLRSFIKALRQKVDQSRHWLAATNSRASKRSYYWSQAGKSGSKFTLSQERYMVTSTG